MTYDSDQSAENPVADDVQDVDDTDTDTDTAADAPVKGTSDPGQKFREMEISEQEQREIAEERERRLDPANRPEGAEVDNTQRTFEDGEFKD